MYCAKCGTKIKPGKVRCDKCGAAAPAPDYCGGFWGLLSKPESVRDAGPKEDTEFSYNTWSGTPARKETSGSKADPPKRTGGVPIEDPRKYFWTRAAIPAIAAAALFLVILIVVSVRGGGERTRLQEQLTKQNEEMQGLRDEKADLEKTVEELTTVNAGLEEDKADLQGQVTELEAENRRLMRHNLGESRQGGTGEDTPQDAETDNAAENTTTDDAEEDTVVNPEEDTPADTAARPATVKKMGN